MGTAIQKLEGICAEIYSRWDKDMRSGKLLSALAGGLQNYRQDVTDVRAALEENDRLRTLIAEFVDAEDAVETEAARAEKAGGGWSSAPVVRRLEAVKAMRGAFQ